MKNQILLFILCLFTLLQLNAEKIKIACIGDSITFGAALPDRARMNYPNFLQEMLGHEEYEVKNFGVNGATLLDKGDRPYKKTDQYKQALNYKADYVFIMLGTNDTKMHNWKHKANYLKDYTAMITALRASNPNADIVLMQSPPTRTEGEHISNTRITQELLPLIQKASVENNTALLNINRSFQELSADQGGNIPDKIHPDPFGAELIAKRVYEYIWRPIDQKYSLAKALKSQKISAKKFHFHAYKQYDFTYQGLNCKIVAPHKTNSKRNWVWRARFWGHQPQFDLALLERGFHIAYCDVSNLYGSQQAVAKWDKFYKLTRKLKLSKKPVLEAMSRGGLIAFNWATKNPTKVSAIYADAPVLDFNSWPAGKGKSKGSKNDWDQLKKISHGNPIDSPLEKLKTLADAKVPLIFVCGLADQIVPFGENTAIAEKRYQELGGEVIVIRKEKIGHHPHSLTNPFPIVKHIIRWTGQSPKFHAMGIPAAEYRNGAGWGGKTWWSQFDKINATVAEHKGKSQLVFFGDSITQNWTGRWNRVANEKKRAIDRHFGKYHAIGMGISGDRTEHLIYRAKNGHFKDYQPKVIVLMIGVNNIWGERYNAQETAEGIEALVKTLRKVAPRSQILLHGPFATGETANSPRRKTIVGIHQRIASLDKLDNVHYFPLHQKLIKEDGTLNYQYMSGDKIHLKRPAYDFWAHQIKDKVEELMKK